MICVLHNNCSQISTVEVGFKMWTARISYYAADFYGCKLWRGGGGGGGGNAVTKLLLEDKRAHLRSVSKTMPIL